MSNSGNTQPKQELMRNTQYKPVVSEPYNNKLMVLTKNSRVYRQIGLPRILGQEHLITKKRYQTFSNIILKTRWPDCHYQHNSDTNHRLNEELNIEVVTENGPCHLHLHQVS
jgi:hypothetical protein